MSIPLRGDGLYSFLEALSGLRSCSANAACDPAAFLKYEDIKSSKDLTLQYSFLNTLSENDKKNIDTGGGFNYDGIPINGHAAGEMQSNLNKQLKIDFSSEEKTWYTISKLSTTGKDAYLDCLKNDTDNFHLTLIGDAMKSDEFAVIVKSTPKQPLAMVLPVSATVIKGQVAKGADTKIVSTKEARIPISRKLDAETIISVKVGDEYKTIDLPPRPDEVKVEVRSSKPIGDSVYGGPDDRNHTLCVDLPNDETDAMLIPGSLKLNQSVTASNMGVIAEQPPASNRRDQGTRSQCTLVYWHLSSQQGRITGTAWVTALVAKVVPHSPSKVEETSASRKTKRR